MRKTHLLLYIILSMIIPSSIYAITDDAKIYYTMDDIDTIAPITIDTANVSAALHNGTILGSMTTGVTGKLNQAYDFDGSNDCISSDTTTHAGDTTTCIWAQLDGAQTNSDFLTNGAGGFHGIRLNTGAGDKFACMIYDGGSEIETLSTTSFSTDGVTWQHACCVSTADTNTIYVNGVNESSITAGNPAGATEFVIGGANGVCSAGKPTGVMDEAVIYERALTSAEVATLYNGGDGFNPFEVIPTLNITVTLQNPIAVMFKRVMFGGFKSLMKV